MMDRLRTTLITFAALLALGACSEDTTALRDPDPAGSPPPVLGAGVCAATPVPGAAPETLSTVPGTTEVWGTSRNFGAETQTFHRSSGLAWTASPLGSGDLWGITALSRTDAWAVGSTSGTDKPAILRFNGTTWRAIRAPAAATLNNLLYDVSAAGPNLAWAVGEAPPSETSHNQAWMLRWNGKSWSRVVLPSFGVFSRLDAVEAISANDVWAAGIAQAAEGAVYKTLLVHYDGRTWKRVALPSPGNRLNEITDIAAAGRNEVWATGFAYSTKETIPLAFRFDGTSWKRIPLPRYGASGERGSFVPPYGPQLFSVDVIAPDAVWAGGSYVTEGEGSQAAELIGHALILRWDGRSWTQIEIREIAPLPESPTEDIRRKLPHADGVQAIAATAAGDAYVVGFQSYLDEAQDPYGYRITCP